MPCHGCGARQDDPARGPSPWKRGVIASEQVLVCPDCQATGAVSELDRCPACDGTRLSKTLGVVRCSGCGWSGETEGPVAPGTTAPGLADDVRGALDRMFGAADRGPDR